MKEILKIYGEFFVEALSIGLLFINVVYGIRDNYGNKGVFHIIGNNMSVESVRHTEYVDFRNAYKDECDKSMPQIHFLGNRLKVGNNELSDYLVAYDYAGRELPITIKSIIDMGETELLDIYNRSTNEICFSKAGIYIVEAETWDYENRVYRCKIEIPVCL